MRRAQLGGKGGLDGVGVGRGNGAGGVQGTAKAFRGTASPKGFEISEGRGGVSGNRIPAVQYGLGAVQSLRRLPENLQGMLLDGGLAHTSITEPNLREKLQVIGNIGLFPAPRCSSTGVNPMEAAWSIFLNPPSGNPAHRQCRRRIAYELILSLPDAKKLWLGFRNKSWPIAGGIGF